MYVSEVDSATCIGTPEGVEVSAPVQALEGYFLGGGDSVLSEMSEKVRLEGIEGYVAGGVCA